MAEPESEGYLGVVPDFGIFQHTPHKLAIDLYLNNGFEKDKLDKVIKKHSDGVSKEELLSTDSYTTEEMHWIDSIYHSFGAPAKVEDLKKLIPYTFYIHGKFHYIQENCIDPTIPYEKIIPFVKELGYEGYIASEYEGHGFDFEEDCLEQLRRFVKMNTRLLKG